MSRPLRILHAIHDFLPRHLAGSELYAFGLCNALARRGHHVTVLCAEYDPARSHAQVNWRVYEDLQVIEIVNNWIASDFESTYRSPAINDRIDRALHAVQPDIVHVHNLMNLSMDLPRIARQRGSAVVATLHDYTMVCPSGGQRVHVREEFVCRDIDPSRCARCFSESPFGRQLAFGQVARAPGGAQVARLAKYVQRVAPILVRSAAGRLPGPVVSSADIERRLTHARQTWNDFNLVVAPSQSLATEYLRMGVPAQKIIVSDNGHEPLPHVRVRSFREPTRIGFVGTLIWHKGVHVLLDAVRQLAPSTYTLRLHGDVATSPDYASVLRRQAEGLPVEFCGRFERSRLGEIWRNLDVVVVPSLWLENSPLVIHEAFQAGVAIVASNIGGIPDLIVHKHNGLLVDAGDSEQLANTLRHLIEHPEDVESLIAERPPVKTFDEDALDWEARYRGVLSDCSVHST